VTCFLGLDFDSKLSWWAGFFTSHIKSIKTNACSDSPISTRMTKWPAIILSHGLIGNQKFRFLWNPSSCIDAGVPEIYSTFGEYLASSGYIVFAPAHTDGSCPELCADLSLFFVSLRAYLMN